ncbi:MAG: GH32 C-terminal domain-containing protein [Sphingobacteriales bacterium]|nr:GH32 C-terminal domain-containing protein [Sphingobacteriales bacterium]
MSMNASMQYFVGEFDGVNFVNENPTNKIYRPDYGPDYYAAICYNQLPGSAKPTAIGWLNNWYYANDIPTSPWKGAMSLPRTLSVRKENDQWILIQKPVSQIAQLRSDYLMKPIALTIAGEKRFNLNSRQFEMQLTIEPEKNSTSGVRLVAGNNHPFEIGYNEATQTLYIDRSKTANQTSNENFKKLNHYEVKLPFKNNKLSLRIFFDHSIVEIFANDGEAVLTTQIFPDEKDNDIQLFSANGKAKMNVHARGIKSIWQKP